MDIPHLKLWMEENQRDRFWLAHEIGAQKRSVDNWFTAGEFPIWACKHIERIISESKTPRLRFDEEEWDRLEQARTVAGYTDRKEFYVDAINAYARKILDIEAQNTENRAAAITRTPAEIASSRLNEPPPGDLKGKQPA